MKKYWLNSLLRAYALALISILVFIACLLSYSNWQSKKRETESMLQRISSKVADEIDYYYQQSNHAVQLLIENSAQLEGLYRYFSMSPSDYISWTLNHQFSDFIQPSIHKNVEEMYMNNEFIKSIAIALQDYRTVFVSTREKQGGKQLLAEEYKPEASAFPIMMYDSHSEQVIGTAYITIDQTIFEKVVQNIGDNAPVMVRVSSPYHRVMFSLGEVASNKETKSQWLTKETAYDYQVEVAFPRIYVVNDIWRVTTLLLGSSIVLSGSLYLLLKRMFHRYQTQVSDIVDTMRLIAQGDNQRRIDTSVKEEELLVIAENTNTMLDSLEHNIRDIYQLELRQKDANMRALQAQINPHFMYNTLEFIRMYAVMQSQEELADIIYEFSSLLRNNTSDEMTTTIANEFEFCRKYSYLCMVRFPKSVAYDYKIDEGLEEVRIPKFTIQPLVENYFAHGIDHAHYNNAISVKAIKRGESVEILIRDNGKGMDEERLEQIQTVLKQRSFKHHSNEEERRSIGIINVHERFVLFFGERYSIEIQSKKGEGVTYRITIQQDPLERYEDV